jgi:hypothetical protein
MGALVALGSPRWSRWSRWSQRKWRRMPLVWLLLPLATGVAFLVYPWLAVVAFEASGADAPRVAPPSSPAYRGPAPGLGTRKPMMGGES